MLFRRQERNLVKPFETSVLTAVKCYTRSAATHPRSIRDLPTLQQTVKHLLTRYFQLSKRKGVYFSFLIMLTKGLLKTQKFSILPSMISCLIDFEQHVKISLCRAILMEMALQMRKQW